MPGRIRRFYDSFFSVGDRLGEAFYAVWMAVVSIGLLNSVGEITPDHIAYVIVVAFAVNFLWGIIDGWTVMLTNVIERAQRDQIVHNLRIEGPRDEAEESAFQNLDDSIASALDQTEQRRIIEAIAKGESGQDPRSRAYRAGRNDWYLALGILAIDVVLVVPVAIPLILISDVEVAVYVSRLISTLMFAYLGASYARNLNRKPWPAGLLLGGVGFAVFTLAYETGW